jgi:integrase
MATINLTARTVESLKPPEDGRVEYFDENVPGFGLRIAASGRKTWMLFYRRGGHTLRRWTIGTFPALSLADAREAAQTALRAVAKGGDPAADKKAARRAETVTQLCDEYLERYAKKHKRSWRKDEQIIKRDIKPELGTWKVGDVKRRDVIKLLDEIVDRGSPIQANRVLEVLRKMFNWAIERSIVEANPCQVIGKPSHENRRDRVLSEPEIWTLWRNLPAAGMTDATRRALKLTLITAQRPGEVTAIEPAKDLDLDKAQWRIPPEKAKNGRAHVVPLSPMAVELIREQLATIPEGSRFLFPAPGASNETENPPAKPEDQKHQTEPSLSRALRRNFDELKVAQFTPHDLRRTGSTHMGALGVSRFIIDRVLNHVDKSVGETYDQYSYLAEKRDALERWATRLQIILASEGVPPNVVTLRRA